MLPAVMGLSTAGVYGEADRLAAIRTCAELEDVRVRLCVALDDGTALAGEEDLLQNDLQRAAVSLCPEIADRLELVLRAGAAVALVSGSGPTVLGLFAASDAGGRDGLELVERAASSLHGLGVAPICATPVGATFGRCVTIPGGDT